MGVKRLKLWFWLPSVTLLRLSAKAESEEVKNKRALLHARLSFLTRPHHTKPDRRLPYLNTANLTKPDCAPPHLTTGLPTEPCHTGLSARTSPRHNRAQHALNHLSRPDRA